MNRGIIFFQATAGKRTDAAPERATLCNLYSVTTNREGARKV